VEAPVDNLAEKSSDALSDRIEDKKLQGGVIFDIGTGDGRFVSRMAAEHPDKFFVGIDANAKPLEKPSMKATRKPAKGGLPNALFVEAAIEDLPAEFDDSADEIHIHFPWGSLLKAVCVGDPLVLSSLFRIAASGCLLEIVIGIDPARDATEIMRLGVPALDPGYINDVLVPRYVAAGFELVESGSMAADEWSQIETSWARKLQGGDKRKVIFLVFETGSAHRSSA
jgi:16S rRNA (adenine(1408)-N(1))-methyltransferase